MSDDVSEGQGPPVNPAVYARQARILRHLVEEAGLPLEGARVLDFGCGRGEIVRNLLDLGIQAEGFDLLGLEDEEPAPSPLPIQRLRWAPGMPYRLPFEDGRFDAVVSNQVLEHVMDWPGVMAELRRITRPGGVGVHLFPPRWAPLEHHVFVPLAGAFRNRPWLWIWAQVGIRNAFQKGLPPGEVVDLNHGYLRDHTTYPSLRKIQSLAGGAFDSVTYLDQAYLCLRSRDLDTPPWKRGIHGALTLPGLAWFFRVFGMRVLLLK